MGDILGADTNRLKKSSVDFGRSGADLDRYLSALDVEVSQHNGDWGTTKIAKEFESHYKEERDDFMTRVHGLVGRLKNLEGYVQNKAGSLENAEGNAQQLSALPIDV